MGDKDHEVLKVCLPTDKRYMSVMTSKELSCRKRLNAFLKDGEGCLMPSSVIIDQVKNNRTIEQIRNEVQELQQRVELGQS